MEKCCNFEGRNDLGSSNFGRRGGKKIYCNFEGTDTAAPSHLEITFALTCKRQPFCHKKPFLCKHKQFFCQKVCTFHLFVVILRAICVC